MMKLPLEDLNPYVENSIDWNVEICKGWSKFNGVQMFEKSIDLKQN